MVARASAASALASSEVRMAVTVASWRSASTFLTAGIAYFHKMKAKSAKLKRLPMI
ncbi:hypothetical protein D3C72_2367920 [compost metagenome]